MAVIIILLTFPNVLINEIFLVLFGRQVLAFNTAWILTTVLFAVYVALAEMDDRKFKKKQTETAQASI